MKLIKPSEISGKILTLLDESDERVILVSPYIRIAKWYRLRNKIMGLKARAIPLEIYVRDDPENKATYHDLDELDLNYFRIPYLHSKLYMNEKYGIVSSMNLLLSSELNSLEIAYVTESWEEYVALRGYYLRYIQSGKAIQFKSEVDQRLIDSNGLIRNIKEKIKDTPVNLWPWLDGDMLHISTGRNRYFVVIFERYLRITAHVRISCGMMNTGQKEMSMIGGKIKKIAQLKITVQAGRIPGTVDINGQISNSLRSMHIGGILNEDLDCITASIIKFIDAVEELKPC